MIMRESSILYFDILGIKSLFQDKIPENSERKMETILEMLNNIIRENSIVPIVDLQENEKEKINVIFTNFSDSFVISFPGTKFFTFLHIIYPTQLENRL